MQPTLFDHVPEPTNVGGKVVVQHNALVNARFDLSTVEMRLFMAMLSRIRRDDNEFREMRIPLTEIVALSGRRPSAKDYQQVAAMCDLLVSRILHIERPPVGRRRERRASATPDFDKLPLMAYAKYRGEEGALRVRFNDEVMPYLLQLHQNFTKAQVVQLLKLKSPHSYRIYWLLKEYAAFGTRVLGVSELKSILNLDGQYKQFPLFRLRVLDRARQELSQTDLPFEYELLREGKSVAQIKFTFKPLLTLPEALEPAPPGWQQVLKELGLAPPSLAAVQELVDQGSITPDYVQFVVRTQQAKFQEGKVKSLPGSVFTAITKQHLLAEHEAQCKKNPPPPANRRSKQRSKLLAELEDARNSLKFVLASTAYSEGTRPAALDQVRAVIAGLETQLLQLPA
ncbi:replication initiation protein [Hymenobacter sp. H14-R3]|uniref:replication initiation protein n=1 Tax=Hymenobacter sp. H14-R3 TaxID=3046308 RepID=UPI0024BB6C1E|nr:replication initiation protein [Hymenobacter sp. H14-R3]MDJ0366530.1 replication initiation protein [Hymenobacter sp. H14-R3]